MDPLEGALRSPTRFNADAAGHIFDPPPCIYVLSLPAQNSIAAAKRKRARH